MRLLVLSLILAAAAMGCADRGVPGDGGSTDSASGGDPGDDGAEDGDGDGGENYDRPGDRGGDRGGDPGDDGAEDGDGDGGENYDRPGDRGDDLGGDPEGCRTHQDCATPDNPAFPEGACCACGAWCNSGLGTCTYMCADAVCCFMGTGCGENCEALCDQHDHCWAQYRCMGGECLYQPPACGVEPDQHCHPELEAAECLAVDGYYLCSPAGTCRCICPTGDADCPCWNPDHCDSQCTTELQGNDCADVRMGTCTGLVQMPPGCYCVAENDGSFSSLCID